VRTDIARAAHDKNGFTGHDTTRLCRAHCAMRVSRAREIFFVAVECSLDGGA
jgi:hypothetical protein